jgi:polyisoprenoid-binding protein YceI
MILRRWGVGWVAAYVALVLVGCAADKPVPSAAAAAPESAVVEPDLAATYTALGAAGGRLWSLDPKASSVRIYVFRAGTAARLGHNHVLSAPQFDARLYVPPTGDVGGARFDLQFRLDQLEIDNASSRAALGPAFATAVSDAAVEGTREHMLSADSMDAAQFPSVRVSALEIAGEMPKIAAKVRIGMHGRSRDVWVPLNVEVSADRVSVSGALVVRLTDFQIRPYSVLGGLLAIKDEILIEFDLAGS